MLVCWRSLKYDVPTDLAGLGQSANMYGAGTGDHAVFCLVCKGPARADWPSDVLPVALSG